MKGLADPAHKALAAVPAEHREDYVNTSSEHPDRRVNLDLAQAAADLCDEQAFRHWLSSGDEYLATCAAIGIGRLVASGRGHLWPLLRQVADDPRWRVREGVAMGLRRIADADVEGLLDEIEPWVDGSPLLRRAAVAGLAEPGLLTDPLVVQRVTMLVERVTWTLRQEPDRHTPEVRALRTTLSDGWNVMMAIDPGHALPAYTRMAAIDHPDTRWIAQRSEPPGLSAQGRADPRT